MLGTLLFWGGLFLCFRDLLFCSNMFSLLMGVMVLYYHQVCSLAGYFPPVSVVAIHAKSINPPY